MTDRRAATVLIVDDDKDVLTAARLLLGQHFRNVLTCDNPAHIDTLMNSEPIDVFLLDMNFAIGHNSGKEGLKWLAHIRGRDPDAVVVLMTAFGDLNSAVRAMREGAADFVLKPWQNDKLVATLTVAAELRRTRATVSALSAAPPMQDLIGDSPAMRAVLRMVERVAPTDANVLIRGENGTGKELIARALHRGSARNSKVLMAVDLGAVAESLFESELFGHAKGAFTDAVRARAGRFVAASGGTLFLDEIGNLPPTLQSRLLRALESREIVPVGSDMPVPVDVRLICATNQPLEEMVADGRFREDLLYRINTVEIVLPPLRERSDDLDALAAHFVALYARKYRLPIRTMTPAGMTALREHSWPGNVRELSHAIERAMILCDTEQLDADDFDLRRRRSVPGNSEDPDADDSLNLETNEKRLIRIALDQADGNISHAANALGLTRAALYRRIEKFAL